MSAEDIPKEPATKIFVIVETAWENSDDYCSYQHDGSPGFARQAFFFKDLAEVALHQRMLQDLSGMEFGEFAGEGACNVEEENFGEALKAWKEAYEAQDPKPTEGEEDDDQSPFIPKPPDDVEAWGEKIANGEPFSPRLPPAVFEILARALAPVFYDIVEIPVQ